MDIPIVPKGRYSFTSYTVKCENRLNPNEITKIIITTVLSGNAEHKEECISKYTLCLGNFKTSKGIDDRNEIIFNSESELLTGWKEIKIEDTFILDRYDHNLNNYSGEYIRKRFLLHTDSVCAQ
jgi:hypothetical protein